MRIKNWTHQMSCDLTSFLITWLNKISSFTLEDSRVPCLRAGMLKSYCLGLNSNSITYYVILSESGSCSVVSDSLWPHELYSPWNSPGQNTGVVSLWLLQGIFQTQGSNPGLPHCRRILYQLSYNTSWSVRSGLPKRHEEKRSLWLNFGSSF